MHRRIIEKSTVPIDASQGAACAERVLQCPPDGCLSALILARQLGHCLASRIALSNALFLAGIQRSRATEFRTLALRSVNAGLTALADEFALELGGMRCTA
jgi:hypothetical protein